jgi:hypothetical protein
MLSISGNLGLRYVAKRHHEQGPGWPFSSNPMGLLYEQSRFALIIPAVAPLLSLRGFVLAATREAVQAKTVPSPLKVSLLHASGTKTAGTL